MLHEKNLSEWTLGTMLTSLTAGIVALAVTLLPAGKSPSNPGDQSPRLNYQPRRPIKTSGLLSTGSILKPWAPAASLEEIGQAYERLGFRLLDSLDQQMRTTTQTPADATATLCLKAEAFCYEGRPRQAYQMLSEARALAQTENELAEQLLYTIIYFQGVAALRAGEDENCVMCRGESSCILPISAAAVHTKPDGSRLAIKHFTEYLEQFPDDLGVRWLLNLAHMTLGEHPAGVDSRYLMRLDAFMKSEFDIGRFRDVAHLVGVNHFNQAGGAIMDDFDNDGLLDLVTTTLDATQPMAFFRNRGDGTFEDRTSAAKLSKQLGGLYCVQGDYNNDGHLDIFICRGAWAPFPMRPSLLRNNGDGTFTDVTREAGLDTPINSISAAWADFDNDGHLDLFVCCEMQTNRLYRNRGNGTFEEVALRAGVAGNAADLCKGAAWIDLDNSGYPGLFVNNLAGTAQLYRNNRDGTFTDVTVSMGINGPTMGFSCWAWDFDNDGYLDILATSYARSLEDVVRGLIGQPHRLPTCRLYRNLAGKGFKDVTREAGLDGVYATMGSNFGDFDNDGYLDFYLATGDPELSTLVPNRMFRNVGGKRFAEITSSSGTGLLQKGHAVACGDWDRNGTVDLFAQTGGAINGDRYHNVLFQNPGQGNNWLTVKLVGKKTNRSAIGARIKAIPSGEQPLTIHRHVSSGSSFGANPLQQTLGLAKAGRVAQLEIHWPTSGTTQVFRDVDVNQAIEITEFASSYRKLNWKPVSLPR